MPRSSADSRVSKDGTRIPVMILHRKGIKLDGTQPTLLYAYGGYGISMTPYFSPCIASGSTTAAFLRWPRSAAEASTAMRGTRPAMLTRKQNVFDDFAASHAVPRRPEVHESRSSRHHGRQQRRA